MIELWIEGYAATGEYGTAMKLGEYEVETLDEAILAYERENNTLVERYEGTQAKRSKYGIWACRIFDNEVEARKSFG